MSLSSPGQGTPSAEDNGIASRVMSLTGNADADALLLLLYESEVARCVTPATVQSDWPPKEFAKKLDWTARQIKAAIKRLDAIDVVAMTGSSEQYGCTGIELRPKGMAIVAQQRGDAWPKPRASDDARAKRVFVISGRNDEAVDAFNNYLRAMGLEPVEFERVRAELGGTAEIARIVKAGMDRAHAVLALVTPEEFAALHPKHRGKNEEPRMISRWQARPNVIFEAGMAFARDRDRFAFVIAGEAQLFTDVDGIHVFRMSNSATGPRTTLAHTLKAMGCAVNDSLQFQRVGDFVSCVKDLPRVNDPFAPLAAASAAESVSAATIVDDDEAVLHLQGWASNAARTSGATQRVYRFTELDSELGFVPGTAKRIISDSTLEPNFKLAGTSGGSFRIERRPARVREVLPRGGGRGERI